MKIGMDISQTAYRGTGVARFMNGLTETICKHDRSNEWHFFFSSLRGRPPARTVQMISEYGFKFHRQYIPQTILSKMWNDAHRVSIETFTGSLDWFITSDWTEPPAKCKKATIIHDLAYIRHPETVDRVILNTMRSRMSHIKRETAVILADSESTRDDVIELLGIPAKRVIVNYPGVNPPYDTSSAPFTHSKRRFILSVGKREPRKNLDRLISAYSSADLDDIDLVIVGEKGWGSTPQPKNSERIHFLGFVNDDELVYLYAHCLFFVYPSIWEGFGYPVIEAMSYGAPVATSNTSSLGEIAKGHAITFDPLDVNDIADSIKELSSDKKLRDKLSVSGKKHASEFTWERYYRIMMKHLV